MQVNEAAKRGKKFVGFVTQHFPHPKACNGTSADGAAELESTLGRRNREHRRENFEENYKNWNEGTLSGHSSESGIEEEMHGESRLLEDSDFQFGKEVSPSKPRKGDGNKCCLFVAEIRYFIEALEKIKQHFLLHQILVLEDASAHVNAYIFLKELPIKKAEGTVTFCFMYVSCSNI